ncbi:hypothetical protein [Pseudomonas laurylsulfatiphila]|uniref:hypothetical protein n=1 Tax=Pseudomonas laurylsulfatiphila TaxID=2011015 RepID=UPI003D258457
MDVNDNAGRLIERGALASIASRLAPTENHPHAPKEGMRWRHGFNEILSIVRCFTRPQDELTGSAKPPKIEGLTLTQSRGCNSFDLPYTYKNKGSP